MYKFVFCASILYNICITIAENVNNFGPYEPVWDSYETCRGPKLRNVSTVELTINRDNGSFIGYLDLNFTTQASVDEVKIVVHSVNGNKTNFMWAYKVTDPCQHFVIAGFLKSELNAHNCVVEKGIYNRSVNFSYVTKKLIGSSFFYGKYVIKAIMLSKKGNIFCLLLHMNFIKSAS